MAGITKKGIIKDIIIVAVGVTAIWAGLTVAFGTQNPFYVVSSGSMVPALNEFDLIVVQGNVPFEEIEIGDVIVFDRPRDRERVIVHRVAAILEEDPRTLRTKGDANPASIPGTDSPITEEEYIGEVHYTIPQVGYITRVLQPPVNYIIIAVIIGIMIGRQVIESRRKAGMPPPKKTEGDKGATGGPDSKRRQDPPRGAKGRPEETQNRARENTKSGRDGGDAAHDDAAYK